MGKMVYRKDDLVKVTNVRDGNFSRHGIVNHPCGEDTYSVSFTNGTSAVYDGKELWLIQKASESQTNAND